MIRVLLPAPLKTLARVSGEITLDVSGSPTLLAVLDAIELRYPMLRGTIRDQLLYVAPCVFGERDAHSEPIRSVSTGAGALTPIYSH